MKGKLVLITVLVLLFALFIAFKFLYQDRQNAFGQLKIVSSPSSTVFIDNVAIGKTPYEGKQKIGEALIKLIPEGTATETASWQGRVAVTKNSLTYINRELGSSDITSAGEVFTITKMEKPPKSSQYGEVYVESDPAGAIVYLDNDEKGIGPLIMTDVMKGEHELSVFLPGFFRRTEKINVEAGYRLNAYFKLALDQSQTPGTSKTDEGETAKPEGEKKTTVTIKDTPTGWLRVREEPNLGASESAKVNPGEKYDYLGEEEGWYKIKIDKKEGWISSQYAEKSEQ